MVPKPKAFVREIMTTGVINVAQDNTVQQAVDLMAKRNISCVIVTKKEDSKRPIGLVTERDLVQRVLQPRKNTLKTKVSDIMTPSLITVSEEASLDEAMRVIESMRIRRLPVVGEHGLVGLVTQTDIVHETYNIHQHNKRLTFHQNLQSYIILGTVVFFIIVFIVRFYF